MQEMIMKHKTKSNERFKSLESIVSNLITLMSQRALCTLPSQTEANPKKEGGECCEHQEWKVYGRTEEERESHFNTRKRLSIRRVMRQQKVGEKRYWRLLR
ncbi:hypothetical protein AAZX31_10G103000 [Glycine max]